MEAKVGKLVMSSSPSTRFDGSDIDGCLGFVVFMMDLHGRSVPSREGWHIPNRWALLKMMDLNGR